ncbi:MAG: hypothetical protein WBP85_06265 [Terracidiphilus sp.]
MAKLAYAAGYFDGEGTINVLLCKGLPRQIRVELTSYDLDALLVFQDLFGGKPRWGQFAGVKFQVCRWAKNNSEAISVLSAITPFLRAKKEQALLALDSGWVTQARGRHRLTENQKQKRAALYVALKAAKERQKKIKKNEVALKLAKLVIEAPITLP